jgi:hypothetical protein
LQRLSWFRFFLNQDHRLISLIYQHWRRSAFQSSAYMIDGRCLFV